MLWSIDFYDDKMNRRWSYDKVVQINVRQGYIQVLCADAFVTRVGADEFTRCEIRTEEEE